MQDATTTDSRATILADLLTLPELIRQELRRVRDGQRETEAATRRLEARKAQHVLALSVELAASGAKTNEAQRGAMLAERLAVDDEYAATETILEAARMKNQDASDELTYLTARLSAARASARILDQEA